MSAQLEHWPRGTPPRTIAERALQEILEAKPQTAEESHAIVDRHLARYRGGEEYAEIVRDHVRYALERRRYMRRTARDHIAQARGLLT